MKTIVLSNEENYYIVNEVSLKPWMMISKTWVSLNRVDTEAWTDFCFILWHL